MTLQSEDRSPGVIAFSATFIVLSSLVVILRLVSRRISAAHFGYDDAVIVLSLVSS